MEVKPGDTIVVWFSCGAASAVATKVVLDKYSDICDIRVVNNPIKDEDEDNQRFLIDVESWLGVEIEKAVNPRYPNTSCEEVWEDRRFMSGPMGAPCTLELKKNARAYWESNNHFDWLVLGFTAEEKHRYDRFKLTERENLLGPLIDENITKADCFNILFEAGIVLPSVYYRGYPNANCIGCVKASSATYWNHVRKHDPDVFEKRAKQSREIGSKLVIVHPKNLDWCYSDESGKVWYNSRDGECLTQTYTKKSGKVGYKTKPLRIFLDELDPDLKGRSMKGLDFECGIFCEER